MYCPECGKLNPEANTVCDYCNATLVDNAANNNQVLDMLKKAGSAATVVAKQTADKAKKIDYESYGKKVKSKLKIIIPVAILLIAVASFFAISSAVTSPEYIAKNYFKAMVDGDFEKMYSYISVNESDFVTKDAFVKYMSETMDFDGNSVANYSVSSAADYNSGFGYNAFDEYNDYIGNNSSYSNDELSATYVMTYTVLGDATSREFSIQLQKLNSKKMLFFNNYGITISNGMCNNFEIQIPDGANYSVSLDGIALEKTGANTLHTGAIFCGNYNMTISGDFIEDYNEKIYISDDYYYEDASINVADYDIQLKSSVCDGLVSQSKTLFESLYLGAAYRYSFSDLKAARSILAGSYSSTFEEVYNDITDAYADSDNTGLMNVSFSDFKLTYCDFDGASNVEISCSYKCDYTTASEDYWDGSIYTNDNSTSGEADFGFVYENGQWVLANVESFYIY